jgi:hypothetical protein
MVTRMMKKERRIYGETYFKVWDKEQSHDLPTSFYWVIGMQAREACSKQ